MQKLDPRAVWLFFFPPFFAILSVGLFILIIFVVGEEISSGFVGWFVLALLVFSIFPFIYAKLSYHFYRYELTDNGFRKESGIIWKKYTTIPYERIQNVDIYRGIIARILGLSDLHIQTAGTAGVVQGGLFSSARSPEGQLPGLSHEVAEQIRDELIQRARQSKHQGL